MPKESLPMVPDWAKEKYEQWTEGGEVLSRQEVNGKFFVLFKYEGKFNISYSLQTYFRPNTISVDAKADVRCEVKNPAFELCQKAFENALVKMIDAVIMRLEE